MSSRIGASGVVARALLAVVDIWYQALRSGGEVGSGPHDPRAAYLTALWGGAVVCALAAAILPGFRLRAAAAAAVGSIAFVWGVLGGFSIGLFLLPAAPLTLTAVVIEGIRRRRAVMTGVIWMVIAAVIAVAASLEALTLP